MSEATWRVLCEGGDVHAPVVVEAQGEPRSFFALTNEPDDDHSGWGEVPRLAVIDLARKMRWPVREILAPGELSAEERIAAAVAAQQAQCGWFMCGRACKPGVPSRFASVEAAVAAETKRCAEVCRALAASVPAQWRGAADACADAIAAPTVATATLVKVLPNNEGGGEQRLYRCDPPMRFAPTPPDLTSEYVVTSTLVHSTDGPETYVFRSDAAGEITNFVQGPASISGVLDHEAVLREAGYVVAPVTP